MKSLINKALAINSAKVQDGKGKNIIPPPEKEPWWKLYLEKFTDPIVIVLLVVFVLSMGIAAYEVLALETSATVFLEPMGVLVALLLSTLIGFIFEQKANNEFQVLNKVKNHRPVKVYRRKTENAKPTLMEIPRCDVVEGDIVRLDAGDEVPGDGEILYCENLSVDESIFTGELYAHKSVEDQHLETATYPTNFLLRGTTVIDGYAIYVVKAVGEASQEGRGIVQERLGKVVETPLNKQLAFLGKVISIASFVIASLIIVGRIIYMLVHPEIMVDGLSILGYIVNTIMIAVTLIVVAVPEGLPMSVTVSLALSMRRMLQANNLVRKLHACETMGATTVICTDKTGTLTQNKMEVVDQHFYDKELHDLVIMNVALNSTAELDVQEDGSYRIIGNPTEGALLRWITTQGYDYHTMRANYDILRQQPFSTETKQMETTILYEGKPLNLVKGAPEIVLQQCSAIANGVDREQVEEQIREFQNHAMRTLGFAIQKENDEMLFLGVVAIADPIRTDVPEAIRICTQDAKVRVIIVTGDNKDTAAEIARQIGVLNDSAPNQQLDGVQFAAMEDEELLRDWIPSLKILSRARPEDKARLVALLQRRGEVVAVTGDGTNDALALSKAEVGISMGSGTSRAKEASDITIIDNSFASINNAILWGRSLYLNIKRFILFQMTINMCACLIVLIGAFLGMDSPLTVTQMLWVNLIMDTFAAMALSSLPADPRVMQDAPRNPKSHIIDRRMVKQIAIVGAFMFAILFGLWQLMWHTNIKDVGDIFTWEYFTRYFDFTHTKLHVGTKELSIFFSMFVLLQFWNIFNVKYFRTDRSLLVDAWSMIRGKINHNSFSKGFLFITIAILIGQVLIVQCAGSLFNVEPLALKDWLLIIAMTSPVLLLPEIWRTVRYVVKRRR